MDFKKLTTLQLFELETVLVLQDYAEETGINLNIIVVREQERNKSWIWPCSFENNNIVIDNVHPFSGIKLATHIEKIDNGEITYKESDVYMATFINHENRQKRNEPLSDITVSLMKFFYTFNIKSLSSPKALNKCLKNKVVTLQSLFNCGTTKKDFINLMLIGNYMKFPLDEWASIVKQKQGYFNA